MSKRDIEFQVHLMSQLHEHYGPGAEAFLSRLDTITKLAAADISLGLPLDARPAAICIVLRSLLQYVELEIKRDKAETGTLQ
jgi:hypothetical protein